jgi:hypothetical protein
MKKYFYLFSILILLLNLIDATQIWTDEGIKVSNFREKVDLYKESVNNKEVVKVKITDLFSFSIPQDRKNENLSFVIMPTTNNFANPSEDISDIRIVGCGAGNAQHNYSVDKNFGLSCSTEELNNEIIQKINRAILFEFNASKFNWAHSLGENNSKTVYISLSYVLNDLVLETDEMSNTLLIRKIRCYYDSPDCLNGQPMIYLSIPTYFSVNGGYNYQILGLEKESSAMLFFQKNIDEDLVLSYRDVKAENKEKYFDYLLGIITSLIVSLIVTLLSLKISKLRMKIKWAFLMILVFLLYFVITYLANKFEIPPLIKITIILVLFVPFSVLALIDLMKKFRLFRKIKEKIELFLFGSTTCSTPVEVD